MACPRGFSVGALAALAVACGGEVRQDATGLARCGVGDACGGDLTGSWIVESYCLSGAALAAGSPPTAPECDAETRRALSEAVLEPIDTRITFDATTYRFSGTAGISYTFDYTQGCYGALSGGDTLDAEVCRAIGEDLRSNPPTAGTCSLVAGVCRCEIDGTILIDDAGAYDTTGTEIRFDGEVASGTYCVEPSRATIDSASDVVGRLRLRR